MNCCGGHGNHDDQRAGKTSPQDDMRAGLHDQHGSAGEIQQHGNADGQDADRREGHGHGHGPGMLLMLLCCLLPMLVVAGFIVRGRGAGGGGFTWLMLLLCPLMHVFMMRQSGNSKHQ